MHISEIITTTLGSDFYVAQKKCFDYIDACDQLALFDYVDVPKILKEHVPEHVSEIRFSSNLTHLIDVRDGGYDKSDSELFNALY